MQSAPGSQHSPEGEYAKRTRLATFPGGGVFKAHPAHNTPPPGESNLQSRFGGGRRNENDRQLRHIFHVLVVPGQVPLKAIELERRFADAVVLVGINHKLRLDAQPPQCLI